MQHCFELASCMMGQWGRCFQIAKRWGAGDAAIHASTIFEFFSTPLVFQSFHSSTLDICNLQLFKLFYTNRKRCLSSAILSQSRENLRASDHHFVLRPPLPQQHTNQTTPIVRAWIPNESHEFHATAVRRGFHQRPRIIRQAAPAASPLLLCCGARYQAAAAPLWQRHRGSVVVRAAVVIIVGRPQPAAAPGARAARKGGRRFGALFRGDGQNARAARGAFRKGGGVGWRWFVCT